MKMNMSSTVSHKQMIHKVTRKDATIPDTVEYNGYYYTKRDSVPSPNSNQSGSLSSTLNYVPDYVEHNGYYYMREELVPMRSDRVIAWIRLPIALLIGFIGVLIFSLILVVECALFIPFAIYIGTFAPRSEFKSWLSEFPSALNFIYDMQEHLKYWLTKY